MPGRSPSISAGKAFWLKVYKPEDKPWQSLSLINGELALADGEHLLYINPENGKRLRVEKWDLNALPIVVNGHLMTMDEDAKLTVY